LRILLLAPLFASVGCADSTDKELLLFAASSAREALEAIVPQFEAENPGFTVQLQSDSSSRLRIQIDHGASADVFLSANPDQVHALSESPVDHSPWAFNQLVVGLAEGNPAGIQSLSDLAKTGTRLVRAQDAVPAGAYTLAWLEAVSPDLRSKIEPNFISLESNVRQVRSKLALGEVDAAFLYKTDLGALPFLDEGPQIRTQLELALLSDSTAAAALYEAIQNTVLPAEYGFGVHQP